MTAFNDLDRMRLTLAEVLQITGSRRELDNLMRSLNVRFQRENYGQLAKLFNDSYLYYEIDKKRYCARGTKAQLVELSDYLDRGEERLLKYQRPNHVPDKIAVRESDPSTQFVHKKAR